MNQNDLHSYQRESVNHILTHTHCALFLEMGLGKTVSTLTAVNTLLYEELDINRVLVIAPKRVAESVWTDEIGKWDHLRHLKAVRVIGTEKQRREALNRNADIYLLGRDNVEWLCHYYGSKRMPFDMLVIDELSSFKNPKAKRFKALRAVQPYFKRVVGLTGTPAPNGLIDIWSQVYLLDRGERLGKFITHYRNQYFHPGKRNGMTVFTWDLNPGADDLIHSRIKDICMSMSSEDYLQMPERTEVIVPIRFTPELQAKYDRFERDQVLQLAEAGEITAVNAAVLANKLLQFANGAIYDEDQATHEIHDLKIQALKDIIESSNGQPVLVAWTFQHDRDRLLRDLAEFKPRQLGSADDIREWNEGKIPVLLMHPASGGHGLNLQAGGHIIVWFGQTWSLELEQQFNARLYRQGQKHAVVIHKLVAVNTMDWNVIQAQKIKDQDQSKLLAAVRKRIEKYVK